MAAELDTIRTGEHAGKGRMVFGGELPWHRDGVQLTPDEQRRFDRVVELIDAPLEKRPYYVPAPAAGADGRPNFTAAADAFYVYRPDTQTVLGAVGADYEPVSNRDAFAVLRPLVDDGTALIETAGVLRGGADAWMLTRWDTDKLGPDARAVFAADVLPYAAVLVNHTGRRAMLLGNTAIRIVCANTLGMAEREAGTGASVNRWVSVDHRSGAKARLAEAAAQLFGGMVARFEVLARQYRLLRGARLSEDEFATLVTDVVAPDPRRDPVFAPEAKLAGLVVERAERKRAEVRRLWDAGAGHVGDRSAWEAFNAAAELLDHNRTLYPTRAGAFRTASLLTGQLAAMKNRILDNLVNHALSA
jgi:phage/plasmid-like protein (TIGR03299 family)